MGCAQSTPVDQPAQQQPQATQQKSVEPVAVKKPVEPARSGLAPGLRGHVGARTVPREAQSCGKCARTAAHIVNALICRVWARACRVEPKAELPSAKPSEVPHVEKAQVGPIFTNACKH